ncbi:MAG: hypothetical protein AAF702_31715 [Chloroflexota bacterium]
MMATSPSQQRPISGANHAVLAVCLSALVMIIVLLSPTIKSAVWANEPTNIDFYLEDDPITQQISD